MTPGVGLNIGGRWVMSHDPPGPPGVGPIGPSPGKSNGLSSAATSPTGAFSLASAAWTLPRASGATATAHRATKSTCSGAAIAAASTIAATVSALALEPSIAALTISHAQSGAAETSVETISRTFDFSAATACFTERESWMQSTAALAGNSPNAAPSRTKEMVFFILLMIWGSWKFKWSGQRESNPHV